MSPTGANVSEIAAQNVLSRRLRRQIPAHYWATLFAVAALLPALRLAGLPIRFTWADDLRAFWITLAGESIFGGTLLYIIAAPYADSLGRLFMRYSRQKTRLLFLVPMIGVLMLVLGIYLGLVLSFATIVILEVKDRAEENHISLSKIALDIFWPAAYFFVGFVVILAYNDVIAALRYNGSADYALKAWDSYLLGGHSISDFAHAFIRMWPGAVPWLDFIYFAMFAQVGGCIAILALSEGRRKALQFVGTIMVAFYLALALFYIWPAAGPFVSCPDHFSRVPEGPMMYSIQRSLLSSLERFRLGQSLSIIGQDYYIGLPCMHIVEPIIMLWYLRRWKRLLIALILFDVLLVPAIFLLEEHYLVDLLAALPVAVLAILLCGKRTLAQVNGAPK